MIGGPPTMMPPGFVQAMPVRQQPPAYPMTQPQLRPAAAPRPIIRAQAPDEQSQYTQPARSQAVVENGLVSLSMPSPEQLGITQTSQGARFDWAVARSRLDRLGAVCFNLEKVNQDRFRFTCLLPTTTPNRNHRVEAVAASEAEAVQLALEKSEQWAGGR